MFWANLHNTQNISKYQLFETINRPSKYYSHVVSLLYSVIQNVLLLLTFQSAYWKDMGEQTDILKTDDLMECV